ncbi:CRISPR-associated ring nuclease Csm6 [Aquibium microcysteis]|uniref:CRISPR-associated ring nuclease Csm6 n=1 Tax=Aquibium microcysteis TaxID=675281 RepID=UPI00165D19D5|nr:CRISPR-associated ring nuclease Csm6 [Aquibium microcysteis]
MTETGPDPIAAASDAPAPPARPAAARDPSDPSSFPRRVVVATLGLAPQVLTETLWCLATRQSPPFVPTEIHVLTTREGARRARETLTAPDGGQLAALARETGHPALAAALAPERIHVIATPDGEELNDIDSPQHNAAAADLITQTMRGLAADADAALHVSIAGGRKTMGFLLGYALSLYGRPQDRLSHVLVSPPFEGHPDFFFPPAVPVLLQRRGQDAVSTEGAEVTLAEIPFVGLRAQLPPEVLDGKWSYSETVALARGALAPGRMVFDPRRGTLECQGVDVPLAPQTFALAALLARRIVAMGVERAALTWRDVDWPAYLAEYEALETVSLAQREALSKRLSILDGEAERVRFQEHASRLRKAIREALGPAADPYLPVTFGSRPSTRVGFRLDPSRIVFAGDERAPAG